MNRAMRTTLAALALAPAALFGYDYSIVTTQTVDGVDCEITWNFDSITYQTSRGTYKNAVSLAAVDGCLRGDNSDMPTAISTPSGLLPVIAYGDEAFADQILLESVVVPNTIQYVGSYAFAGCMSLTSVTLGNAVTEIGDYVFFDCPILDSVTLNDGLRVIGACPFVNTAMKSLAIPDTLLYADGNPGAGAIYGLEYSIGDNSHFSISDDGMLLLNRDGTRLYGCSTRAEEVTLPDALTDILSDAFFGCFRLSEIAIPAGVTNIASAAFNVSGLWPYLLAPEGEAHLETVTFLGADPALITAASDIYYGSPSNLETHASGDKWKSLGATWRDRALVVDGDVSGDPTWPLVYTDASGVEWTFTLSGGSAHLGGSAAAIDTATSGEVTVPDSVTGEDFEGERAVTSIGANTFRNCSKLTKITIGSSVTSVADGAFDGCTSLAAFAVAAGNPSFSAHYGSLYSKDAKTLVKIPAAYRFATTVTSVKTLVEQKIVVAVQHYAKDSMTLIPAKTTVLSSSGEMTSTTTRAFTPDTTFADLVTGVTAIAAGAFADCGTFPSGETAAGKLVTTTDGKVVSTEVGAITMVYGTDATNETCYSSVSTGVGFVNDDYGTATPANYSTVTSSSTVSTPTVPVPEVPSGVDCPKAAWRGSVWYDDIPDDALPSLSASATPGEVSAALALAADPSLGKNVTTAADYAILRAWALAHGGLATFSRSSNSWSAYALDAPALLSAAAPVDGDVVVSKVDGGDAASGSLRLSLSLNGVQIGDAATSDNLKRFFRISGSASLGEDSFDEASVSLGAATVRGGAVEVTVSPAVKSKTFFFRVGVSE